MSPATRERPSPAGWWARSAPTMLGRRLQPVTIILIVPAPKSANEGSTVGTAAQLTARAAVGSLAGPLQPEELVIERAGYRPGPVDQLAMTVWVVSESGSCTVRKETPASYPSSIAPRAGGVQPEAEAVPPTFRGNIASGRHAAASAARSRTAPSRSAVQG